MAKRPMTADDLWRLPRVGEPEPFPDGKSFIVPVTRYSVGTNQGTTRLWLVPAQAERAGTGGANDPARPLTAEGVSSQSPAISPDGLRLAFVRRPGGEKGDAGRPVEGKRLAKPGPRFPDVAQLYVMPMDGGEGERITDVPLGVIAPTWLPDGKRIAFLSPVYSDALDLEATAQRAQERKDDPVKAYVTENRFYRYWDHWLTDGKTYHIFVVDLESREIVDLIPESTALFDLLEGGKVFQVSPEGTEVVYNASRTDPPYDPIHFGVFTAPIPPRAAAGPAKKKASSKAARPKESASKSAIRNLTPKDVTEAMDAVYSPDGRWIAFGVQRDFGFYADKHRLVLHDRKTGKQTVLSEKWDLSANAPMFSADSKTLLFVAEIDARIAYFAIDVDKALKDPDAHPPRELVRGGTFSSIRLAGKRMFTTVSHIDQPPEVVSFDLSGRDQKRHTAFTRPVLDELLLSEYEDVTFTGAEGHQVHMVVVYPPGVKKPKAGQKPARKYPLVHMIHGGPHGVFGDAWHWRWCAQVFVSPGYVAALVNFHGSTSWGQDFTASILGRWGDQPYHDVLAATDHLVQKGIADPKRIAITGGSYGGYLVSWITSQTDRFACAINHAGVSDFQTQYASDITQGRNRAMGGEPWKNLIDLDRYNPMRHAKGFKTPMLVIHGELDYRVPYNQGLELYNVYKAMKLPARLVVYPDENHWILKPRNSLHWYGEVLGWLHRWIGK